jgi:hypothetical protein
MQDLERHAPEDQLNCAKAEKEDVSMMEHLSVLEWKKADLEAEIKFVCLEAFLKEI